MSNETLGSRLAIYRKSLGFSQKQLADLIGISQGYVGDVEADRSGPSTKFITLMLKKTNVSSDWLLTGEGPMERERAGDEGCTVLRLPPLPQVDEQGAPYNGIGKLKDYIKSLVDQIQDERGLRFVVTNIEAAQRVAEMERRLEELSKQANRAG